MTVSLAALLAFGCVTAQSSEPQRLALLVGVAAYGTSPTEDPNAQWSALKGTLNDVQIMEAVLLERGFAKEDIVVLLDEQVTSAGVEAAFQNHLGKAEPGDVAVFYYSGHGQQVTDLSGDEADGLDEAIVPWDNAGTADGSRHILDDQIQEWMDGVGTQEKILIFDSCNSGTLTRGPGMRKGEGPAGKPSKAGPGKSEGSGFEGGAGGYVMLSAARSEEPARELVLQVDGESIVVGAMTYALVQSLEYLGPQATWKEVADSVRMRVRSIGLNQVPQVEGDINKRVFSSQEGVSRQGYRATVVSKDFVEVEAGLAHGLKQGDVVTLYAVGRETQLAKATIAGVELDSATAALQGSLPSEVKETGLRAVVSQPQQDLYLPRVDLRRAPKGLKRALADSPGVDLLPPGAGLHASDVILELLDTSEGKAVQLIQDGHIVPIPLGCGKAMTDVLLLAEYEETVVVELLVQALRLHRIRTRIEVLHNPAGLPPMMGLELFLVEHKVLPDGSWAVERKLGPVTELGLPPGSAFVFEVVNHSQVPLYFGILELNVFGGVQFAWPHTSQGQEAGLVPAGERRQSFVFSADSVLGPVSWKAVGTPSWVDYSGLGQGVRCTRGEARMGQDPLATLLQEVTLGTRSAPHVPAQPGVWGTTSFYAEIAPDEEGPGLPSGL